MSEQDRTTPVMPAHMWVAEPQLAFHPTREQERSPHPLRGLREFGPYSRALVAQVFDPIRVATIAPAGRTVRLAQLLADFEREHQPRERQPYLLPFPGFRRAFNLRLVHAPDPLRVELPGDIAVQMQRGQPHLVLADALSRSLQRLGQQRSAFDLAIIYLSPDLEPGFTGPDDFDLHDYVKATAALLGIPVQIVLDHGLDYRCQASVLWHLGIALYVKAGGVPWKLAEADAETAYVGLGYTLRRDPDGPPRHVICCSQIFDSDGTGLEFVLYETSEMFLDGSDPYLTRPEMHRVMARTLALYQRRHAGQPPRRVVVHKTTEFKDMEIDGVFDAFMSAEDVELVHVKQSSPWRGINLRAKQDVDRFPVERGTALQLSPTEAVLWTQGNAPTAVGGANFYQERRNIPHPIELVRYAGQRAFLETCRDVIALTKMDWNRDALYDRMPVTIQYAQVMARIAKRMPSIGSQPYPMRYFI